MNRLFSNLLIIIFLIIAGVAFGSLTFEYFTAKTISDGILVEWKTGDEGGTIKYEIERSAANPNNFMLIKTIGSNGNNSYYSYTDTGVDFVKSGSVYYYRLKCINNSGSYTYTNTITVVHTVSGIKNTWGSIKAIFR